MTLSDYLKRNDLTAARFGQMIGVTGEAVRRYAAGKRTPRPEVMRRIVDATDGAVDFRDFYAQDAASEVA